MKLKELNLNEYFGQGSANQATTYPQAKTGPLPPTQFELTQLRHSRQYGKWMNRTPRELRDALKTETNPRILTKIRKALKLKQEDHVKLVRKWYND